jgi:hypothetical protein
MKALCPVDLFVHQAQKSKNLVGSQKLEELAESDLTEHILAHL